MPYSLKDIGDRLAALEASQSGGGGSGQIAAISMNYPVFPGKTAHVFFYTTQETTVNVMNIWCLFVAPGYTMYIRLGGSLYSYIGRIKAYETDVLPGSLLDGVNLNLTYYFTKN